MSEDKVLEVLIPEGLKEPLKFDYWRMRIADGGNVVFDFAKKDVNDRIILISSVLLEKEHINNFLEKLLCFLYK